MRSLDRRRLEAAKAAFAAHVFPEGAGIEEAGNWVWIPSSSNWILPIEAPDRARDDRPMLSGRFSVDFRPGTAIVDDAVAEIGGKVVGKAPDLRIDEWEGAQDGDTWYLNMPAETLREFIAGEVRTLTLSREGGSYWLNDGRLAGQNDFHSLEAAKAAGERIAAEAHDALSDRMARDAGLDPDLWIFKDAMTGVWFASAEDELLSVERHNDGRWVVARDETIIGEGASALEALQSVSPAPAR